MNLVKTIATKPMKRTLSLAVARLTPPRTGRLAFLLRRLRALRRRNFRRRASLAGRFNWKAAAQKWPARTRAGWLVVAVRWFAQSCRSHPVKIQIRTQHERAS